MPFQLNPSKVPIWKSDTELRLGLQDEGQVIQDVSHAQERLISLLFQGIPEDQISLVGSSVGLAELETKELVEQLRPSLLETGNGSANGQALDVRFAEIIRIGFETNDLPESVLAKRAKTVVQIQSLNRTGLVLIKALCEAGFNQFETLDYGFVRREDLGELSYRSDQLGISRLDAARSLLAQSMHRLKIGYPRPRSRSRQGISILSAMHQINPSIYREVDFAHISIEYGIETLRISPVIVPGRTPCLGCRDLWESENNPEWASIAIQLTGRNDHLDDGSALLLAVAITTKSICRFVDVSESQGVEGFQVSLKTRSVSSFGWQHHPSCRCANASLKPNQ